MIKKGEISASMMCADLIHLKETVDIFERNQIEYLHIDVMDGDFVPNWGLGVDYVQNLRDMTDIPMDFHFMVQRPEDKLKWMKVEAKDRICIHYESTVQVQRTLEKARKFGGKVTLAISPATPIFSVLEVLDDVDGITILTVNPGFAGQKIVASAVKKTKKLSELLEKEGYGHLDIEVDGNISLSNAKLLRGYGANIFVGGTSSLFTKNYKDLEENIFKLREAIL